MRTVLLRAVLSRTTLLVLLLCVLGACTSQDDKWLKALQENYRLTEQATHKLGLHLDTGHLKNAELLKSYAQVALEGNPASKPIITTLASNASTDGPMYKGLIQRLNDINKSLQVFENAGKSLSQEQVKSVSSELHSIAIAARVSNFDSMLIDPINVIAGMSGGKLAKVSELAYEGAINESSTLTNESSTAPVGSELVGNPTYGSWQTDSSGSSFWAFYGQYALLSRLFDRPVYYDHWSRSRRPSYYHDYGRDYYSSPKQKANAKQADTRTRKQFNKSGKRFQSPYAKKVASNKRSTLSRLSKPSKFNSSYARTSIGSSGRTTSLSTNRSTSRSTKSTKTSSSIYSSRSSTSSRRFSRGGK